MRPESIESTNQIASKSDAGSPPNVSDTSTPAEVRVSTGMQRHAAIRHRLASLVIACVLPVWIAAGFLLYYNFRSRRALTEQRMLETARALTMVVDRELANIQASLSVLATSPSLVSGDLPAFYRQAQAVVEAHPGARIFVSDATGQELINTVIPFGAPLPKHSVPDAVRQVYANGRPVITNAFKGALTGRLQVGVEVPVFRNGRVVYDLGMNVPADRFATILLQQHLPPEWLARIYDSSQHVVIGSTEGGLIEKFVGRQAPPALSQHLTEATEGNAEASNLQGIPMFNSFSRSATSGWTVVVGVPKAIMMAEIWRWLWLTIAGTALLSFTGIALALPIGRGVEKTERALRQLSAIVESSDDAIIGYRLDGIVESWNRGAERLFGYSAPEIVGRHISMLVPDDQLEGFSDRMRRVRNGEVIEQYRTTRKHKNGLPISVALKISPILDQMGTIVGASAIVRDITNLNKAEEALRQSEERFKLAVRAARDIVWDWDIVNDRVWFSELFFEVFGYDPATFPTGVNGWAELVHPEDSWVIPLDEKTYASEEYRLRRADGTWAYMRDRKYLIRDAAGSPIRKVGVMMDITEDKRAEEALQVSQRRLAAIIGSAMDAIITISTDQRILVFNAAAEQIFGCPAAEAIGHPLDRFIPAQFREAHRMHVETFASSGTTTRSMHSPGILFGLRANGEEFPLEAAISQMTVGGERLYTVILRDITQRKQAEEALLRSEKLASVGRMAASIAHEINNPLAAMTNTLYLARTNSDDPASVRQYLDIAEDELRRVSHITRQTLGFYRESSAPTTVSVGSVVDAAVDLLRGKIKVKRAIIEKKYDGDLQVSGIPGELRQVFSNLLTNSLDAIGEAGTIKLRVSRSTCVKGGQPRVRVTVADNGSGIDAATLPRIFEPLFTTKESTGSGLGLWVIKQLIEKHGGSIRVRSRTNNERRGTTFSIVLPVGPAAAASSQPAGD